MCTAPTTKLQIYYHLRRTTTYRMGSCKRCARLTKALASAPESLRFEGSQQFGINTCMANGKNIRGNTTARRNQPSLPVSQALAPCAKTTRLQAQATRTSLRFKAYAERAKTCAWRITVHLHPCCAQHTSLRASYSTDKVQHQLRPPKSRIPIPCYTSYNTTSPSYTPLSGVMTVLASDLLDSGGWVPRSLQVHHQWCTGGQRGVHPWDHNDGPRGHFHKSCNQQPTIRST